MPEFLKEIEENEAKGMAKVTPERLRISDRAHIGESIFYLKITPPACLG